MPFVYIIHWVNSILTQERGGRVRRIKFVLAEDIKSDALPQPCVLERSRLDVLYGELFDCERETELDWWLDDAQVTLAPPTNSIHIPSSILPTRRRPEYSDKQHTCCSATGTFFFFFFFAIVDFGQMECG